MFFILKLIEVVVTSVHYIDFSVYRMYVLFIEIVVRHCKNDIHRARKRS